MPTTGGALAFKGFVPPYEATLVKNLRDAGAIIIAKTNMTELANWVASGMPNNYNALAGYGLNPYDPRRDPRPGADDGRPALNTGGSSSGAGTAASFWAANVGTETSGSILSPANQNMLAAIKPTVGRISRYGVIPITADQDTPGPMARTVTDAAIMLGVLEGAADPNDAATSACARVPGNDYTKFLSPRALEGARIGVPRASFYEGLDPDRAALMEEAIAVLTQRGATVVDPSDLPSVLETDPQNSFLRWSICGGTENAKGRDQECSVVLKYGMKRDFNAWLASLGSSAPVKTLTALREWNLAHAAEGAIKYGQAQLDISDEMDVDADRARYEADRAKDIRLGGTNGIDAAMTRDRLDALLFPSLAEIQTCSCAARLSHRHGPVRIRAERPNAPVSRDGLAAPPVAVRRELHGHGLQRAAPARHRVRLRAGHQAACPASTVSLTFRHLTKFFGRAQLRLRRLKVK